MIAPPIKSVKSVSSAHAHKERIEREDAGCLGQESRAPDLLRRSLVTEGILLACKNKCFRVGRAVLDGGDIRGGDDVAALPSEESVASGDASGGTGA